MARTPFRMPVHFRPQVEASFYSSARPAAGSFGLLPLNSGLALDFRSLSRTWTELARCTPTDESSSTNITALQCNPETTEATTRIGSNLFESKGYGNKDTTYGSTEPLPTY